MLQYLSGAARAYAFFLALFLGAAVGSFLNCAAWRTVHGESFMKGRSHCPKCGHILGAAELVPVFGWVFLRGRCKACKKPISVRYPLTELGFALITLACLLRFDVSVLFARNIIFLACLYFLSLTDLEAMVIPDGCLIVAALAWAAAEPFIASSWAEAGLSVASGLVYGGVLLVLSLIMERVRGKEALGGGDIKLFAVVGLYLGFVGTLFALLLSCVVGLLFALLLRAKRAQPFAFGPAIALSTAVMLLWGDGLVNWYLSLLGF
ncbi:MAG: prepilin peptidase [Oscillospiraceae bacterium]|nr:prepilin peptidase [Oscillospiraceae bacterium]